MHIHAVVYQVWAIVKLYSIQHVKDALGLIATFSLQIFKKIYFDGFIISASVIWHVQLAL